MTAHENEALKELTEQVSAMRSSISVLHTKMFGDEGAENSRGRIPTIEATLDSHSRQLHRIERAQWMMRGVAFVGGLLMSLVVFIYHLTQIAKGR